MKYFNTSFLVLIVSLPRSFIDGTNCRQVKHICSDAHVMCKLLAAHIYSELFYCKVSFTIIVLETTQFNIEVVKLLVLRMLCYGNVFIDKIMLKCNL